MYTLLIKLNECIIGMIVVVELLEVVEGVDLVKQIGEKVDPLSRIMKQLDGPID